MTKLGTLFAVGRLNGKHTTHVTRVAVFGSRRTPDVSASDARSQRSALGKGPHSVWQGPKVARGKRGAPIVKRARFA